MKKVTRFVLQIIALITMTIDHSGKLFFTYKSVPFELCFIIGRIAFPLFCFMIAEGARHTRNIWKYLARILVFAVLIESFFFIYTYFFNGIYKITLNVFFSLALGLLMIALIKNPKWYIKIMVIIPLALLFICDVYVKQIVLLGTIFPVRFEYSFYGIFLMLWFYLFDKRWVQALGMIIATFLFCQYGLFYHLGMPSFYIMGYYQIFGLLVIPLILMYNGKVGRIKLPRYFMYLYYPIHMLAIYGIYILIHLL